MSVPLPDWMGKYPRKGADWSPEEDTELHVRYSFGHTVAELADRHLREPVAITRRLALLRDRRRLKREAEAGRQMKTWQQERDTAREAIAKFRRQFPKCCWSEEELEAREAFRPRGPKPGDILLGVCGYIGVRHACGVKFVPLTDLPPEVAQALQFGQGEAHAHD